MAVVAENNDKDEYLRHGAIQGMILIGDADAVFAFAEDKSPAVRRAVVLALRRFGDGRIGHFLEDKDLSIAVETVQAINDAYIEGARQDLAAATDLLGKSTWAVDLRILNSIIRAGGDENARRLIEVANNKSLSEDARTEALWLLARFEKAPPTDPTTGMYRPIEGQQPLGKEVREEVRAALLTLLAESSGDLLVEALGLAGKFDVKVPTETLLLQLSGTRNPLQVRLAALGRLEKEKPDGFAAVLAKLPEDPDAKMRAAALATLARLSPNDAFAVAQKILSAGKPSDQQLAIALLGTLNHPQAPTTLLSLMKDLDGQAPAIRLDIIEAARKRSGPELDKAVADYQASIHKDDPLAAFQITLEGGDLENGRNIFFRSGAANCVQCHKVGDRGGDAAPNLAGIADRKDAAYILESIVNPSAKLAAGYSAIAITMKDGSIVAGMLMSESEEEVVVRNMETKKDTVCKRSDIASIPPAMSTMPPMGLILNKADIRDLVAYLSSLKK
jgi:putative heme-binding domain-containing protein